MRNQNSGVNPWKAVKVLSVCALVFIFIYAFIIPRPTPVNNVENDKPQVGSLHSDKLSQLFYDTDLILVKILENEKISYKDRKLMLQGQQLFMSKLSIACCKEGSNQHVEQCIMRELTFNLRSLKFEEKLLTSK